MAPTDHSARPVADPGTTPTAAPATHVLAANARDAINALERSHIETAAERDRLLRALDDAQGQAREQGRQRQLVEAHTTHLQQQVDRLGTDHHRLEEQLGALRVEVVAGHGRIQSLEGDLATRIRAIGELDSRVELQTQELTQARARRDALEGDLTALRHVVAETQAAVAERDRLAAMVVAGLRDALHGDPEGATALAAIGRGDQLSDAVTTAIAGLAARRRGLHEASERMRRDLASSRLALDDSRMRCAALEGERDEVIATTRSEVEQLTHQLDQRDQELSALTSEHDRVAQTAWAHHARMHASEGSLRGLCESLALIAEREAQELIDQAPGIAEARGALDQALARLRSAGEDTSLASEISLALGDGARQVVDCLVARRQALSLSLTRAQAQRQRLESDLARLGRTVEEQEAGGKTLRADLEQAARQLADHTALVMELRDQLAKLAARQRHDHEQLRLAQAEVADLQARGATSGDHLVQENRSLREAAAASLNEHDRLERTLADLSERLEASEARLRSQREEFLRRLAERDAVIQDKDRSLDALVAERTEAKGLAAQAAALGQELAQANERIAALGGIQGEHAGVAVRSGDLARELKQVQRERDQLRDQRRELETALADAVGLGEQQRIQVEEKRKDLEQIRERLGRELAEERERSQHRLDDARKLKEDNVGLKAKLKRLTEH